LVEIARISKLQKLRISIVQYLNTAPLVWGFTNGPLSGKYDLSFTVPSQCAEALRGGAADIAIIPAIEYQRISGLVVLPDLAIASQSRVRSLMILAKKPIERVRSIALDSSSRSTQALTRILAAEHWRIAPEFFETAPDLRVMLEKADAALLIGDPALRISIAIEKKGAVSPEGRAVCQAATLGIAGPEILHVYDVVGEWRKLTGLPAVMAVWAARREVITPEVLADFAVSREFGVAQIAAISHEAARDLELPQHALEAYLRHNIDFSLGEENRRGLERYFREAAKLGLIPRDKKIAWATAVKEAVQVSAK
jgi:chorismate dehydratase